MTARMSVVARALPSRILLVSNDESRRSALAARLEQAGFETLLADHGREALDLLARQWFPVVIADWRMPQMDGVAFTECLRDRGVDDTYVIMLASLETDDDYERGYSAGVDDFLSPAVPDPELFGRIRAAFGTLALRRSLNETRAALQDSATLDAESGALTPRELYSRLQAEIGRAQRYERMLCVMTLGVCVADASRSTPDSQTLRDLVESVRGAIRAHSDWVGRIGIAQGAAFAIVLPEAGASEAPLVRDRLFGLLTRFTGQSAIGARLELSIGVTALDRMDAGKTSVDAAQMIRVAEHCRACPGRAGEAQLRAVQSSLVGHVAIACRRGYVVDSRCNIKSSLDADPDQTLASAS